MEDLYYETQEMTASMMKEFLKEFDKRVGTDREVNDVDTNSYYVSCFELDNDDMNECAHIETEVQINDDNRR